MMDETKVYPSRLTLAIEMCQKLEPVLRTKMWHCALTGSTLYGLGKKDKDIDIIIYPYNSDTRRALINVDELHALLNSVLGLVAKSTDEDYNDVLRYWHTIDAQTEKVKFDFIPVPVSTPNNRWPIIKQERGAETVSAKRASRITVGGGNVILTTTKTITRSPAK